MRVHACANAMGVLLMGEGLDFRRMTDKTHEPSEEEMENIIGEEARGSWLEIKEFIKDCYGLEPETLFYGVKYGWTVRYRKSSKTLCSLFPEEGGFTVLIVLGGKEAEKAFLMRDELSSKIQKLLGDTEQLHDGRWLWIRLLTASGTDDIKKLLQIKRKPKKT